MIKTKKRKQREIDKLLAHCTIANGNPKLRNELLYILKYYNTSFINLLEQIGVKISTFKENILSDKLVLPLQLTGNISKMYVEDSDHKKFVISISTNLIYLKENTPEFVGHYTINMNSNMFEKIDVYYKNSCMFSLADSFIQLQAFGDNITIILNNDDEANSLFPNLAQQCVNILNNYTTSANYDLTELEEFLAENNFFDCTIIHKKKESA